MCMIDDADAPEFYDTALVRARKAHVCVECLRVIPVGVTHRRASGKWDGRVETYRTCSHCAMLARWIIAICSGYPFGELLGEVDEHLELLTGVDWLTVARALARAKRGWRNPATKALDDVPHRLPLPRLVHVSRSYAPINGGVAA